MATLRKVALPKPMQVHRAEATNKVASALKIPVEETRKAARDPKIRVEEILKEDVPSKEEAREEATATADGIILVDSVVATVAKANAVVVIIHGVAATILEEAIAIAAIVPRARVINRMVINPAIRHENSFCSMRRRGVVGGVWR